MIQIIKGSDKIIVVRITKSKTSDPFNFDSGIELISACFKKQDETNFKAYYIPFTGNTSIGSDIVSAIADTSLMEEGHPIKGVGIPAGATILKTPASTVSPTAAGTVKISVNATANGTGVSLIAGQISILTPEEIGKISIALSEIETDSLFSGEEQNFEVKIIKDGFTSYCQFPASLNIVERYC